VVKEMLAKHRPAIKGIVHCSGGAQTKVLHFTERHHIIKDNLFKTPVLFETIQASSGTDWKEMYQVFNMGHRLELYTDAKTAEDLIGLSQKFGINAQVVGRVEESATKKLTLQTPYGTFSYT